MSEREERLRRLLKGTHYISQEMDIRELTGDYIGPRNRIFLKVDDEQIIFNYRGRREAILFLFGGGGLLWITLPFIFGDPPTQLETIGFIITFILFSVLPCLWVLPRSYKVYTFDRMTGMMTFPNPRTLKNYGRNPGTITFPFSDARFGMFLMQAGRPHQLVISHPDGLHSYAIDFVPFFDALQTHSILVWYMDKNRPLPPRRAVRPLSGERLRTAQSRRVSATTLSGIHRYSRKHTRTGKGTNKARKKVLATIGTGVANLQKGGARSF